MNPTKTKEFFNGMEVQTWDMLVEQTFVLHKPERFVEYDKNDWSWLAYFGFGVYKTIPSRSITVVDVGAYTSLFNPKCIPRKVCMMHPDTWETVKKELKKQEEKKQELFETPDPTKPKDFIK